MQTLRPPLAVASQPAATPAPQAVHPDAATAEPVDTYLPPAERPAPQPHTPAASVLAGLTPQGRPTSLTSEAVEAAPATLSPQQFTRLLRFFAGVLTVSQTDPQRAYAALSQVNRFPGCHWSLRVQRLLSHSYKTLAPQLSCPPRIGGQWIGGPLAAEDVVWPRLECLQRALQASLRAEHIFRERQRSDGPQDKIHAARLREESASADLMLGLTVAELVSAVSDYNPELHPDISAAHLETLALFGRQQAAAGRDVRALWLGWQQRMHDDINSQDIFAPGAPQQAAGRGAPTAARSTPGPPPPPLD